jgi:hypothetical protein
MLSPGFLGPPREPGQQLLCCIAFVPAGTPTPRPYTAPCSASCWISGTTKSARPALIATAALHCVYACRDSHSKTLYRALQCFLLDFWDHQECQASTDRNCCAALCLCMQGLSLQDPLPRPAMLPPGLLGPPRVPGQHRCSSSTAAVRIAGCTRAEQVLPLAGQGRGPHLHGACGVRDQPC